MIKLDASLGSLWSQVDSLGANVAVPWIERTPRDDVDSDTQQVFQILEQAHMIKKGGAWLEIDKQVEVAVWASLSPSDGAEHRDPASPALPRKISARQCRSPSRVSTSSATAQRYRRMPRQCARCGPRIDGHPGGRW